MQNTEQNRIIERYLLQSKNTTNIINNMTKLCS